MVKNKFITGRTLLFISTFFILNSIFFFAHATIRYVSTTGSSTPPYTSWETAADSIQKCINFSVDGDTIIVANGVYYESLIVDKYLWLIGSSMDSCLIDGTGLDIRTIDVLSDFNLRNFKIFGKDRETVSYVISNLDYNVNIEDCSLSNADNAIFYGTSSGTIERVILSNTNIAFLSFCAPDTCHTLIKNSIIIMENSINTAINIFDGGNLIVTDNIILGNQTSRTGLGILFSTKTVEVGNNIVSGFGRTNILAFASDTAIVQNNIATHQTVSSSGSIFGGGKASVRNNITGYNSVGIRKVTGSESEFGYNLYWQNKTNTAGGVTLDSTDVAADPMFVNDTIPLYEGSYDYHLQAYSPAIDAGDPNILDVEEAEVI